MTRLEALEKIADEAYRIYGSHKDECSCGLCLAVHNHHEVLQGEPALCAAEAQPAPDPDMDCTACGAGPSSICLECAPPTALSIPPAETVSATYRGQSDVTVRLVPYAGGQACKQCHGTGLYDAGCRPHECPCGALKSTPPPPDPRALSYRQVRETALETQRSAEVARDAEAERDAAPDPRDARIAELELGLTRLLSPSYLCVAPEEEERVLAELQAAAQQTLEGREASGAALVLRDRDRLRARIAELEGALRDVLVAMALWGSWEDGIPEAGDGAHGSVGSAFNRGCYALDVSPYGVSINKLLSALRGGGEEGE
jgi:hypothetical protein